MKIIKADQIDLQEVIDILAKGGIIIYPTETLYGIGGKYNNKKVLQKIFEIKKRPQEKSFPLIIDLKHLSLVAESVSPQAWKLIEKYWPGPLTLLLPAKKHLPREIKKENKVAVRMPGESFALNLIKISPFPITATSANISGEPGADCVETAISYFKGEKIDLLIDGGKLPGIASTILDITINPPKILRKGSIELSFD